MKTSSIVLILSLLIVSNSLANDWSKTSMDDNKIITCLAADANTIFAGTNYGFFFTWDKGIYFGHYSFLDSIFINNIVVGKNGDIYICVNSLIINSKNHGEIWNSNYVNEINITSISFNKKNSFFISSLGNINKGGVLKSIDLDSSWDIINTGLPIVNDSIKAYDIINKNDTLFVGLSNGLYYSIDDGKQWLPVPEFDGYKIDHFVLNSKNDLFFVVNGTDSKAGVYKNFKKYYYDVLPISALTVNRNDDVFIGTSIRGRGVFYTNDDGNNWTEFYNGLDSAEITALVADTSGIIFAGTNRQGIYKRQISATGIKETVFKDVLSVFPNPFSDRTTIKYTVESANNIKLMIYNSLGQKIKELVNEYKPAGNYEAVLNSNSLSSGIYYYILQSGNNIQSGKLVMIK